MLLHDFIYEWDGKSVEGEKPVSWWPGSYHVKIIKLGTDSDDVSFLVPIAVILKNIKTKGGKDTSLRNYIHNFAQKVSKDYNLKIDKTLWIELDDEIKVARLLPGQKLHSDTLYTISWRAILPNELSIIKPYISDM